MQLTNFLTLSLAALAAAAPLVPSTGPMRVADIAITVPLHDRSLASIWDSITSLVKPIKAPGNKDAEKRDLDLGVGADVELGHGGVKRDLLDVGVGAEVGVGADTVDGGLGAAVVRRSGLSELLTSLNGLITPVDVPGNKDKSQ